jgi:hypothetical protein
MCDRCDELVVRHGPLDNVRCEMCQFFHSEAHRYPCVHCYSYSKFLENPVADPVPAREPSSEEVRLTDPVTGAQKGDKLARFDLIPAGPLYELATHFGRGAIKYKEDRNWERGYRWSLSFAALMRHAWGWWRGEDTDAETGSSHLIAVAWHCLALREFQLKGKGFDDRVKDAQ